MQTTTVIQHPPGWDAFQTGTVHNIVARLKGTANTRAILLDAHYDSAATTPGASDEGSGVVTSLETMGRLPQAHCSKTMSSSSSPTEKSAI